MGGQGLFWPYPEKDNVIISPKTEIWKIKNEFEPSIKKVNLKLT